MESFTLTYLIAKKTVRLLLTPLLLLSDSFFNQNAEFFPNFATCERSI